MKVLVTGAYGQIGSELIIQGQALGLRMVAVGHSDLDISRQNAVRVYIVNQKPDIIINAAAYTAVDKAEGECELACAINRDGPAHLAAECARHNIPFLHISTDYVFDGTNDAPYHENEQPNPQGAYGKSKLEGEKAIEEILEQFIILRVAWVFGAYGNNFVRTMLKLGRERDELRVVADQYGGPTWAGDIASTLLAIVELYLKGQVIPWGTYHYTGEPVISWYGFSKSIFEASIALGMMEKAPIVEAITTEAYPTLAQRPKNSMLNCQKIQQKFGIKQPDWRIGLNNVLNSWSEK